MLADTVVVQATVRPTFVQDVLALTQCTRRMVAQHTLGEKTKPQEFSLEEREILEGIFCTTPYLEREKCDEIMGTFASQPTDTKIRRWFVDR